jgi:two-component system LytT family response regulator
MTVLLVDDEANARQLLKSLLAEHAPEFEVVAEAETVKEAVKKINSHQPNVVFLDIEMPNENGFALFEYFENPSFKTIFCTAYAEFALRAFEVSAVDYILKPISIEKLQAACRKVLQQSPGNLSSQIQLLRESIADQRLSKIALPLSDGLTFVDLKNVLYFEADGSYTHVVTKAKSYLVTKKIKEFDDVLTQNEQFFRCHRSYLINLQNIKKYSRKDGNSIVFENDKWIPVAREKKADFELLIKSLYL